MSKTFNTEAASNLVELIKGGAMPATMLPTMARTIIVSAGNYATEGTKKFSPSLVALKKLVDSKSQDASEYVINLEGFITWLDENIRERGEGTGPKAIVESFTVNGTEYSFSDYLNFEKAISIVQAGKDAPKALADIFEGITFENEAQKVAVLYDAKVQVRRFLMEPLNSVKSGRTRTNKAEAEATQEAEASTEKSPKGGKA